MSDPKFCQYCGGPMVSHPSEDSWSCILECKKCGATCEVTYGDYAGGGRDSHYWKEKSSKNGS